MCSTSPLTDTIETDSRSYPTKVKFYKQKFSNTGRSVLPLRFIDDSEMTSFKSQKELVDYLEATRLCDVMFCSPSNLKMKMNALKGDTLTFDEPFLALRIIIEQLWTSLPLLNNTLLVGFRFSVATRRHVVLVLLPHGRFCTMAFQHRAFTQLTFAHNSAVFHLVFD